jgi:hypothetical protein
MPSFATAADPITEAERVFHVNCSFADLPEVRVDDAAGARR